MRNENDPALLLGIYIAFVVGLIGLAFLLGRRDWAGKIARTAFLGIPIWIIQRIAEFAVEVLSWVFQIGKYKKKKKKHGNHTRANHH